MGEKNLDPAGAAKIVVTEQLYVFKAYTPNVIATSQNLETILGEPLQANVGGVVVINIGSVDLKYQTDGTAASAILGGTIKAGGSGRGFAGNKDHLDKMRFFKVSSDPVTIDQLSSIRGR